MINGGNSKFVNALGAISVNGAATCNVIDCSGYDRLTVIVNFGLIGAGDLTVLKLTEANVASSGTALTNPNDIVGTRFTTDADAFGAAVTFPGNADDGLMVVWEIDLRSRKRYVLPAITTGAATLVAITAILSRAEQSPVSAADRGVRNLMVA